MKQTQTQILTWRGASAPVQRSAGEIAYTKHLARQRATSIVHSLVYFPVRRAIDRAIDAGRITAADIVSKSDAELLALARIRLSEVGELARET